MKNKKTPSQRKAFEKLKEIGHRFGDGKFNKNSDYLAEFSYPFNTSHGLTKSDIK